jgi:hypothetical protein
VEVVPTWIVENARLAGLADNCPAVAAAAPVPASGTLNPVLCLLLPRKFFLFPVVVLLALMLMLSVNAPAAEGAKVVLKVTLCPGASVTGKVGPFTE